MPKISVLITDYKQPEYTRLCIHSVKCASFKDVEILVHDNTNDNIGLAASSNLIAKNAKGEYLFFLNNDTIVKRDIFERLLESKFDITGCRMFNYTGDTELGSAVSLDRFGCPAGESGPVFYPDGAIFMKKSVFEDIGGFDESLFLFGEDRDICWRAFLHGYSVGINYSAVFYHASNSVLGTNYFRRFHSEKNIIRSMLKNYTIKSILTIIPQYVYWSLLELALVSFYKPQAIIKCYIPAYLWNLRNIVDTIKKRSTIKHRIPDNKVPFSKKIGKFETFKNSGVPKWRDQCRE